MVKKIVMVLCIFSLTMGCTSPFFTTDLSNASASKVITPQGAKPPLIQSNEYNDPGSSVYPFTEFDTLKWTTAVEKRPVEALIPKNAISPLPVLVFMGGKKMQSTTFYRGAVEHASKKGLIVLFVEADDGAMPFGQADQVKPARAVNEAVNEALIKIPSANPNELYYAGHSLGAKCMVIAVALATTLDTSSVFHDPVALLLFAFDNSNGGPFAPAPDNTNPANGYASQVGQLVEVTILEFEDDSIAGPKKLYASSLYEKLTVLKKQHILVLGSSFKTNPSLTSDHNTSLTGGSPLAGGSPKINCLDFFMTYKMLAGIPLAHSKPEYISYVYGDNKIFGGICSNGATLTHIVKSQNY